MTFKKIFITALGTILIIFCYGLYHIYDIFYANYFDQVSYTQVVWPGRTAVPSKLEILLWGFTDIKTVSLSLLSTIILLTILKSLKRK